LEKTSPNNCFDLTLLLSRNLLFATLGKFRANVRNAGQANVRRLAHKITLCQGVNTRE